MPNKIAKKLSKKYGKIVSFRNMPLGFKLAMIWYMGIDGEAWNIPEEFCKHKSEKKIQNTLKKNISYFDKEYGKKKFGIAFVPREEFELSLLKNFKTNPETTYNDLTEFLTGDINLHKDASWPVILSEFEDELIQDGWHRMDCYLSKKIKMIPCIYYT